MTEAALSGGAPAPVESTGAPITPPVDMPAPLGSQTPVAEQPPVEAKPDPKAEPSKNANEAIRKANEALKAKEAAAPKVEAKPDPAKVEAKPEAKTPAARSEDGKFVSAEPKAAPQEAAKPVEAPKVQSDPNSPHRDAPARFSTDAKAAWEAAPEPIKAEVHRAIRELEQGHQKYKADSEAYERIRPYDELAKQNGRGGVEQSLTKVVEIEKALAANPINGIEMILREVGPRKADGSPVTLLDVASHIMNQSPDQRASQQNSTIATLQQKISQLEQALGGVTQTIEQQKAAEAKRENDSILALASDATKYPRFEELRESMGKLVAAGMVPEGSSEQVISEAYKMAERLNPAPHQAPAPVIPASVPEARPLNPAGQKSISGAPSSGSDLDPKRGPAPSIQEALKRAKARAG